MSQGKYLSLEEARKEKKLKQFADDHPSVGDKRKFEDLMKAMAKGAPRSGRPKRDGNE